MNSNKKKRGLAVPNPDRRQCSATSNRTGKQCKEATYSWRHGVRNPRWPRPSGAEEGH